MHCLNKNQHVTFFFRNFLIQEKNCFNIIPWLLNIDWTQNDSQSAFLRTCNHSLRMSEEINIDQNAEAMNDKSISNDNFFFFDSSPSPILIDIDHPDKYRKKSKLASKEIKYSLLSYSKPIEICLDDQNPRKAAVTNKYCKEEQLNPTQLDSSIPSSSKQIVEISLDDTLESVSKFAKVCIGKVESDNPSNQKVAISNEYCKKPRLSPKKNFKIKQLNLTKLKHSLPSYSKPTIEISSEGTLGSLSKVNDQVCRGKGVSEDQAPQQGAIGTESDDDILYDGTFTSDFMSLKVEHSSFFRRHLLNATNPSTVLKRSLSSFTDSYYGQTVKKKSKLQYGKSSNQSLQIYQDESSSDTNSKKLSYGRFGLPSSSDSDNEVIVQDEFLLKKSSSSSSTVTENSNGSDLSCSESPKHQSIESTLKDNFKPDTNSLSNPSSGLDKEQSDAYEVSSSDDSIHYNPRYPLISESDDYFSEEEDEESESGEVINVENSNYIPLTNIKIENIEYSVPISEEVKIKRQKFEALRKWELTGLGTDMLSRFSKKVDGTLFTLLSYNVLAQQLINDNFSLYENCDPQFLDWTYRWALLQHEIRHLQPDIMTFQEVETSHYYTHYLPWFTHWGYKCIFKKRTGTKCDGCLIVYKVEKFSLIEENSVEFNQPKGGAILDRDNVGLIAKFTPTAFHSPFCVATTHILYNPKRMDVKLAQLVLLLTELDRICYEKEMNGLPMYCPVILTGDFNSDPYSRLMKVVRNGNLKYSGLSKRNLLPGGYGPTFELDLIPPVLGVSDHCQHKVLQHERYLEKNRGNVFSLVDKRKIEERLLKIFHSERNTEVPSNVSEISSSYLPSSSGEVSHAFNFKSVYYHKLKRLDNAPEVSTFQGRWLTVDYIFYTRNLSSGKLIEGNLKLIGRYGLLSGSESMRIGPLPSDICPSDHFPLAAQFLLRR